MMTRVRFICPHCNGTEVKWDAFSSWCEGRQEEVLCDSYQNAFCSDCDGETTPEEIELPSWEPPTIEEWRKAVAEGATDDGYKDWCAHLYYKAAQEAGEESPQ